MSKPSFDYECCEPAILMRWYLHLVEAGIAPHVELQRWIAQHVVSPVAEGRKPFAKPRNRPPNPAHHQKHALAFLGAYIDPEYRTRDCRFAAIGAFLGGVESTMMERASKYCAQEDVRLADIGPLYEAAADYAQRRRVSPDTVRGWIDKWHDERMKQLWSQIAAMESMLEAIRAERDANSDK